ncbi:MAG: hypothetical protein IKU72_04255 [Oscillospiraceae bacterium]|nr:hypothetical protein [Oscillospiraceae bacterium]
MSMKKTIVIAVVVIVAASLMAVLCASPVVLGGEDLPQNFREAIQSQAKGGYSSRLPLVPVAVTVEDVNNEQVFYTIHYFPFGTVGMSYHTGDGYNIEKPLTRL